MNDHSKRIEARATISIPGLKVGSVALVDPDDDYIRMCLDSKKLVPTQTTWPLSAPAPAPALDETTVEETAPVEEEERGDARPAEAH